MQKSRWAWVPNLEHQIVKNQRHKILMTNVPNENVASPMLKNNFGV